MQYSMVARSLSDAAGSWKIIWMLRTTLRSSSREILPEMRLPLKEDLAVAARVDAHDGAAQRRFAGAGLADESEGLALINVEIRVFYGDEFFFASDVKGDVHMADREDDLSIGVIIRHGRHLLIGHLLDLLVQILNDLRLFRASARGGSRSHVLA